MLFLQYGIPQPGTWNKNTIPKFEREGIKVLNLDSFPANIQPSGGTSSIISKSEMFMVVAESDAEEQIRMRWLNPMGKVISDTRMPSSLAYEFLGHYPWEIWEPGSYSVEVTAGADKDIINFEVL